MDNSTVYTINQGQYIVNRSFEGEKTIKDLIVEIISRKTDDNTFETETHSC